MIIWLREIDHEDADRVGRKAAALGEMLDLGLDLPNGFCVTTAAYQQFIKTTGLTEKIKGLLDSLDLRDLRQVQSAAEQISQALIRTKMPEEISQPIMANYLRLSGWPQIALVAVRSSATDESLNLVSFLKVKGEANVVMAVKKCWTSLFQPVNLLKKGKQFQSQTAVLVQKMLRPRLTGTIKPRAKTEFSIDSTQELTAAEVKDLEAIAKKIRRHYFFPQEIKFAIEKRKIYILEIKRR